MAAHDTTRAQLSVQLADRHGNSQARVQDEARRKAIEEVSLIYQNQLRQYALLAGTGLFLVLSFIFYRHNRQKQKARAVLEKALADLKSAQAQLIQKEKMASLGELTAGVAHEIQNPLNFVNNFSELSTELIGELKEEAQAGHTDDVLSLADGLAESMQKITHHGKRASSIVRGMLNHSRTSTGERQPTNLNALVDEYLRLAYHGLVAKNKPGVAGTPEQDRFNCALKTDFDPQVPELEVASQEIGRVLLNLFNNAFYAVQQKQKQSSADYRPTVWVSTKRADEQVELWVRDNGTGIPDAVKAKIFQPFFTTKPTGEGTGLGLSLSYDIVSRGHGGDMVVNSRPGEFSEFCIRLPILKLARVSAV